MAITKEIKIKMLETIALMKRENVSRKAIPDLDFFVVSTADSEPGGIPTEVVKEGGTVYTLFHITKE